MADKKKPGPKKGAGGRPEIEIDWDLVIKLCRSRCTGEDIAHVLGITTETLTQRCKKEFGLTFLETYKKETAHGKCSLRRWQWELAENLNPTMLIWLGKQELDQSDKIESKDTTDYDDLMRQASEKMD